MYDGEEKYTDTDQKAGSSMRFSIGPRGTSWRSGTICLAASANPGLLRGAGIGRFGCGLFHHHFDVDFLQFRGFDFFGPKERHEADRITDGQLNPSMMRTEKSERTSTGAFAISHNPLQLAACCSTRLRYDDRWQLTSPSVWRPCRLEAYLPLTTSVVSKECVNQMKDTTAITWGKSHQLLLDWPEFLLRRSLIHGRTECPNQDTVINDQSGNSPFI